MPDKLTGLAAFHELSLKTAGSTTAILVDINSMRFLNAHSGHEVADRALVEVASALKEHCEKLPESRLFRVWGDEFLLLLSPLHEVDALKIAAALVEAVNDQHIPYSRPDRPEMDRLAVSAVVFHLEAEEAEAMSKGGPSPTFRNMFEGLLYKEKLRWGGTHGVVVDARHRADIDRNTVDRS